MQQAKKQTQTVLAIQRQHVIKLGQLPGVTGVNVKVAGDSALDWLSALGGG
ncbi:hypothetical protein T492DRAFT_860839 [Pavlovales sp. CCMP2436]|nr:hypothetical protein T492DRAFT_860839 [Pavlovales sp. CCMP2436]